MTRCDTIADIFSIGYYLGAVSGVKNIVQKYQNAR
jgi:hypothetical protein